MDETKRCMDLYMIDFENVKFFTRITHKQTDVLCLPIKQFDFHFLKMGMIVVSTLSLGEHSVLQLFHANAFCLFHKHSYHCVYVVRLCLI